MSEVQVSCVSGTVNRLPLLKRMVASVRQSVGDLTYEIILVDGNSKDGTREWAREQGHSDVVLIEEQKAEGSAVAYQKGFLRARGTYVVTLNDDIVVERDSIKRAYDYLESHLDVGQVAFGHKYQRRKGGKIKDKPVVQKIFNGFSYAQCGMIRSWLGRATGWTGHDVEGYTYYGWDTYLSSRVWELGWPVAIVPGCAVIDFEHDDEIRRISSHEPRGPSGGQHPDTVRYEKYWRGRLPGKDRWIPHPGKSNVAKRVLDRAAAGTLKTLWFKSMMRSGDQPRTSRRGPLSKLGPTTQVVHTAMSMQTGRGAFQKRVVEIVSKYTPDLVMLQVQRDNNLLIETVRQLGRAYPHMLIINWDGDLHYPLKAFNFEIASVCHLQLLPSPTLFSKYMENGIYNVGYWPIGVEQAYLNAKWQAHSQGPDVVFLGALTGMKKFPEAHIRAAAVKALYDSSLLFELHGLGWKELGISGIIYTGEQHARNAALYASAKMALSISATKDLWGYTSDRLYNICATGCPALVQRFNGMSEHGFVDGESCIGWSSIDEMMDKTKYYLAHPEQREAIGKEGRRVVHSRHTWTHRIDALLCILEGM